MSKLGRPYEDLVASVVKALHPGADIRVGEWWEGPDGRREIDVYVTGEIDGTPAAILIECKDWHEAVGVGEVDAFDSKCADFPAATRRMIFTNSRFTRQALRKAERKGIVCASAVASGDSRVRILLERFQIARVRSVDRWTIVLHGADDDLAPLPAVWSPETIEWNGAPLVAWLHERSLALLQGADHEPATIECAVKFREVVEFTVSSISVRVTGFIVRMACGYRWVGQRVRQDVTRGMYDHLRGAVVIPANETWSMIVDQEAWKPIDPSELTGLEGGHPNRAIRPSEVEMRMTLYNAINADVRAVVPDLSSVIETQTISCV